MQKKYTIPTSTSVVDGRTFCDGAACTSSDTIIIEGGARGNLKLTNFDGSGSYISIVNEDTDPDSQVVITSSGSIREPIWLSNCKYVDLDMENDADLTYGAVLIYDGSPVSIGTMLFSSDCDNIKIHGFEMYCDSAPTGTGIKVGFSDGNTVIYDTFDIYNNYIHDVGYAGMYLGSDDSNPTTKPYVANFSVHDNLLEDIGHYGITLKRIYSTSGVCTIYNNQILPSNRASGNSTGLQASAKDGEARHGIGIQDFLGSTYAEVYNNRIEKTDGPGLKIGDIDSETSSPHNIHDNLLLGCGQGNEETWGHGIVTQKSANDVVLDDNIIIQPVRYGVYARGTTLDVTMSRNLIGDAGLGEWYEMETGDMTESIGVDSNVYYTDISSFGFEEWSDDDNYSNDDIKKVLGSTATAVSEHKQSGLSLRQNYPNPFRGETTIQYSLSDPALVNIDVYSITGKKVNTLVNSKKQPGTYSVKWDGCNNAGRRMPKGLYFYTLKTSTQGFVNRKMILFE